MTLTTRLSLFFSLLLAVVLVGFSTALYLLAAAHFQRQTDERLAAALSTLVATAEVTSEGVVWDLAERRLDLPAAGFGGRVIWQVRDERGRVIDHSLKADDPDLPSTMPAAGVITWSKEPWQVRQAGVERASGGSANAASLQPAQPDEDPKYPFLLMTAGVSLAPAAALLRQLALALAGLSIVIWLAAWFAGRAVCRKALLPVSRMAGAAREMRGEGLEHRLPVAATGDELEELGTAFNSLLDRLQAAFERERQFTGDASHQLRTPLAAILGQVEVALRRERSAEEYRRVLSTVHDKAENLTRIIESLLFLARTDANRQCLERATIDLTQWLPLLLQSWSDHERFSDITAAVNLQNPCLVEVQPVLLDELLNILLDNACKFSQPGSAITLGLRRNGQAVSLDVEDHGCGIPVADLPHLFTPFFRGADVRNRKIEGVGLGLSIAKRLAAAIGGALQATSRVGKGSCFTLTLPAADAALNAATSNVEVSV